LDLSHKAGPCRLCSGLSAGEQRLKRRRHRTLAPVAVGVGVPIKSPDGGEQAGV
jgi:hypothetical protein